MKVIVDAREAIKVATGIGTFVRYLSRALERTNDARLTFEILPADYDRGPEEPRRKPTLERAWNLFKNLWWKQVTVPVTALVRRADAIVVLDPIIPLWAPCRVHVLIHDMQTFRPENPTQDRAWARYITFMTRAAKHRTDILFTNSDATSKDVVELLGVPERRVRRVYPGIKDEFRPPGSEAAEKEVRERHRLDGPYILVVGTTDPKRNFPRILEAFVELRKDPARTEQLVCVGPKTDFYSGEVEAHVRSMGLGDEVRFLGYVPLDDLPALYSAASVYLYPSLFEGFGFTPAEAMACGCPVVTSNVSSLPEVVGDAGLTVDPKSVPAITDALRSILSDPDRRAGLGARGLERARRFRWEASAREVRRALLGEPGPQASAP